MKILLLHGVNSAPGGVKSTHLQDNGHEIINPKLDDDFEIAVQTAQAEYDEHRPELIVGFCRGGAVGININSAGTPLVLLCPAWKRWGTVRTVKENTVIIHSRDDEVIPYSDSEELLTNSRLPFDALLSVGEDHQLTDKTALLALLWACSQFETDQSLPWMEDKSKLPTKIFGVDEAGFTEKVKTEFIPRIERSTIPFFCFRKDPVTHEYEILEKERTGVFLRIGCNHFILTASHIIQDHLNNGVQLLLSWDDDEHFFIPLNGDRIVTSDPKTLDVAVIKLSSETSARLLKRHAPITLQSTSIRSLTSDGMFLIVGYPRAGTEFPRQDPFKELKAPLLESLKYLSRGTLVKWTSMDLIHSPLLHVLLGMPRDAYLAESGLGELLPVHQQVQGISGCGIWLIADRRWKKTLDQISLGDCKLIAIEHSYDDKKGIVAGTWIDLVLMMIATEFPETKPAIDLFFRG